MHLFCQDLLSTAQVTCTDRDKKRQNHSVQVGEANETGSLTSRNKTPASHLRMLSLTWSEDGHADKEP